MVSQQKQILIYKKKINKNQIESTKPNKCGHKLGHRKLGHINKFGHILVLKSSFEFE